MVAQVFPTLNNKFPCEGPKVVPQFLDFAGATQFVVDLKMLVQQNKISEVQSIFVDNSSNDKPLSILVAVQRQTIVIPPYSQAYLGILASVAELTVSSQSTMAMVGLFVQNFPVSNCVWAANASGSAQSVNVSNFPAFQSVIVSTSDSVAFKPANTGANLAVTTASASVSIAPQGGQNLRIVNTGAEAAFLRMTTGASTATLNDLALMPGESIILNATGATVLSAICATTGTTLNYVIGNGGI